MKISRFEEIEAWQLARELTCMVYRLTKKQTFSKDYGLKQQIQEAAGSSMHNMADLTKRPQPLNPPEAKTLNPGPLYFF